MNLLTVMDRVRTATTKSDVIQLIQKHGHVLGSILSHAPAFQHDMEVVREAVQINPTNLYYASTEIRNDPEYALELIRQDGLNLRFFDAAIRTNRTIVLEAIRKNGLALQYALELQEDEEMVRIAFDQNYKILPHLNETMRHKLMYD